MQVPIGQAQKDKKVKKINSPQRTVWCPPGCSVALRVRRWRQLMISVCVNDE